MRISDYFIYYCKNISYIDQLDLLFNDVDRLEDDKENIVQFLPQEKNFSKDEITVLFLRKKLTNNLIYCRKSRPKLVKYVDDKIILEYINRRNTTNKMYITTINNGYISYFDYVTDARMWFNDFLPLLYYIILDNE